MSGRSMLQLREGKIAESSYGLGRSAEDERRMRMPLEPRMSWQVMLTRELEYAYTDKSCDSQIRELET